MSDLISEDSSKLQQVRDVIAQIKEEMKPLAKLDGTLQKLSIHSFQAGDDNAN